MIHPGPLKFVEVLNEHGDVYPLWGGPVRFVGMAGIGMPPIRRLMTKVTTQHGMTDRGFRLDQRRIDLNLAIHGFDEPHADAIRDRLIEVFSPVQGKLTLRCTREDDRVRLIDCYVDGEMDFPTTTRAIGVQSVSVPLVCPDPVWYDPEETVSVAAVDGNGDLTATIDITQMQWSDYFILEIDGPVPDATNLLQAFSGVPWLRFDGEIPSGETWRFDFRPETLSITQLSDNSNQMENFTDGLFINVATMTDGKILSLKEARTLWDPAATTNPIKLVNSSHTWAAPSAMRVYWRKRYLVL